MTKQDILFEDVTFTYAAGQAPALKNISLSVGEGELVLITGPAGAGKSSLCYCLNGIIPHFHRGKLRGEVVIRGIPIRDTSIGEMSRLVGMLFQDPSEQLLSTTVADEVAFGMENFGFSPALIRQKRDQILETVGLSEYAERSPHALSGGQQQACVLAATLVLEPDIYVLDEPTSNLDPISSSLVFDLLSQVVRQAGRTMIVVEHKLDRLMGSADRVVVLNEGQVLINGAPEELMREAELLDQLGLKARHIDLLFARLRRKGLSFDRNPENLAEAAGMLREVLLKKRTGEKANLTSAGQFAGSAIKSRSTSIGPKVVEINDLWHTYSTGNVEAIKGISLEIHEGEYVGIIGQNGAGKTTLVKHLNGLLKPTKGTLHVKEFNTSVTSIDQIAHIVGYVFQNPNHQLFSISVQKELEFGPRNIGLDESKIEGRVKQIAESLDLVDLLKVSPHDLSLGQKQKLAVGSVLTMGPDILIVDEPTTGQDHNTAQTMMALYDELNEAGKTVVLITHDIDLVAEHCDRCILMKDGRILLDGPVREVLSSTDILRETHIEPPQITLLAQSLVDCGVPPDVLTVDEMLAVLETLGVF